MLYLLSPICNPLSLRPWACKLAGTVEQTGGYNFSIKGKNKKLNSSLSNQVHNYPFLKVFLYASYSRFYLLFASNTLQGLAEVRVGKPGVPGVKTTVRSKGLFPLEVRRVPSNVPSKYCCVLACHVIFRMFMWGN